MTEENKVLTSKLSAYTMKLNETEMLLETEKKNTKALAVQNNKLDFDINVKGFAVICKTFIN